MQNSTDEFKERCERYFASKEGRDACTCRHSYLVEVEKLSGEVFARCLSQAASECPAQDVRMVIECDNTVKPVVCAKIVDTAKARIPYIFRKQQWSPFKKHEKVLVLLANNDITSLDAAITLLDLGKEYESGGFELYSESLPWVGVGIPEKPRSGTEDGADFDLNLGYKVESVNFDTKASRIVVKAKDRSLELFFGL